MTPALGARPVVSSALRRLLGVAAAVIAVVATEAAATQHLVRPGDDWSKLAEKLKPGDEIVLMPGRHKGARFTDLAGEPSKPIVIRSPDPKTVSTIFADDVGILLERPRWVRIENIVIADARRAGIIVRGEPERRSAHISILNVYVAKTGDFAEKAGIRLEHTDHATLRACRVEAWHRAGVHLHNVTDVALSDVQFVGHPSYPDRYGVAIDGVSSSVYLDRCRFAAGIETAVAIGLADTDQVPPVPAPKDGSAEATKEPRFLADGVTVERSIVRRVGQFVAFGSCTNVLVRANTVGEPETGYAIFEPPTGYAQVASSTFLANLITWTPGSLKRFSTAGGGADPKGLAIEANLWHSAELPAAKSLLGDFLGTIKAEQVIDVDPRLDGRETPLEERAKAFGHTAP
jgi:hypothetical protein